MEEVPLTLLAIGGGSSRFTTWEVEAADQPPPDFCQLFLGPFADGWTEATLTLAPELCPVEQKSCTGMGGRACGTPLVPRTVGSKKREDGGIAAETSPQLC